MEEVKVGGINTIDCCPVVVKGEGEGAENICPRAGCMKVSSGIVGKER